MDNKKINPLVGIIWFAIFIPVFIFAGAPIQAKFGMIGVAITELMILAFAIIPVIALRQDFKEVFPIKKPRIAELFGVLLLWGSSLLLSMIFTYFIGAIDPEGLFATSDALNSIITSVPFLASFVITAIMPAICEEALHRGFILYTFKNIKKHRKFITVLVMGLIFGIFHLDFYRFMSTAILGAALSYIMVETKNILLPMLFHFVNNGFSVVVTELSKVLTSATQQVTEATGVEVQSVTAITFTSELCLFYAGMFMMIGCVIPFTLLFGAWFLQKEHNYKLGKACAIAGIIAGVMFIAGLVIMVLNASALMTLF